MCRMCYLKKSCSKYCSTHSTGPTALARLVARLSGVSEGQKLRVDTTLTVQSTEPMQMPADYSIDMMCNRLIINIACLLALGVTLLQLERLIGIAQDLKEG